MPFFLWRMRCFYSYGIISISFWKHWFAPVQNSGAVYSVWASNLNKGKETFFFNMKTIALMREDSFLDCTAVIPYIIIRHFQTFCFTLFCLLSPLANTIFVCVFFFFFFFSTRCSGPLWPQWITTGSIWHNKPTCNNSDCLLVFFQ